MRTDEVVQHLEPWLVKQRRPAWKPVVEEEDGPPTASKFCGTPWTGPGAPWPGCGDCLQPMQLFLQLDLADLPAELDHPFGVGLLQLFYCIRRDECYGMNGFLPFVSTTSRVRIIHPNDHGWEPLLPPNPAFPAKRIVGWSRFLDLPSPAEHERAGLIYTLDRSTDWYVIECPEFVLSLASDETEWGWLAERIATATVGDKLGGWPAWVQDERYPYCPLCGRQMISVFQIDSEDNIPFMFSDCGIGHITQCPEHKDYVAFGYDGS
ncbi:MAG: DUF1963 domain-containing protein [Fimbriiglobus sp.]